MANRDALKKLIRTLPAAPELQGILDSLAEESDRSAAIVATGIVESVLERVITVSLRHRDPQLLGLLFQNRGPMSDFHGKIVVAHAVGIISPNAAEELHRMKAIRNVFAHAVSNVSFSTKEISEKMSEFLMLNSMDESFKEHLSVGHTHKVPPVGRDRRAFVLVAHVMCIILDHQHQSLGGHPLLQRFNDLFFQKKAEKSP